MKIILASTSPRRAEILTSAGIVFEIRGTDADEAPLANESAEALVSRLAEAKARAAAAALGSAEQDCIVIGADTTVELNGEILGKPDDVAHAREMLGKLSGRAHRVLTGVFLLRLPGKATRAAIESTVVTFAPLTESEIEAYAASAEPLGKAGAYAIQGVAGRYVSKVDGCYFNVVGLPLARVYALLGELGWQDGR